MPLYDVTFKDKWVNPNDSGNFKIINKLRTMHPTSFNRIVQTVDEAVASVNPSKSSKLVWTRAGALFGHSSTRPLKHVEHLWDKVIGMVGDDKECLIAVGSLLRWRISLRDESWLVYRQESGSVDPDSGREIRISEYWINDNYNPPKVKRKATKAPATTDDFKSLAAKFNR